jgi:C4-type Zn-finger protein
MTSETQSSEAILKQLMAALMDLRRQGKTVSIRICPQCKSPALRSLESHYDIGGAMGITPPKYRCPKCGYWSRIIIEATNEDINEELLDDLIRGDSATAQKLLKQLHTRKEKD